MSDRIQTEEALRHYYEAIEQDPEFFFREILQIRLWGKGDPWGSIGQGQLEVARAIREHPSVLVTAANAVGKTLLFSGLALEFIQRPGRVMLLSSSEEQLEDTLWPKVCALYEQCSDRLPVKGRLYEKSIVVAPEWDIQCITTKDETRLKGRHPERLLIIADEAFNLPSGFFPAIYSMLQTGGCHVLLGCNPTRPTGATFLRAYKNPRRWKTLVLDGLDHPNVRLGEEVIPGAISREFALQMEQEYGVESPEYVSAVRGKYPEDSYGTCKVIPREFLEHSAEGVLECPQDWILDGAPMRDLGVDLGRSTHRDPTTIALLEGGVVRQIWKRRIADSMEAIGWILQLAGELEIPSERIHIDCIGIGGPVVDRFHEMEHYVDGVNFAESPKEDWLELLGGTVKFGRRRAELYWVARMLLQSRRLQIPREFEEAWVELAEAEIRYDSRGRILVEEKDQIRKRLGRSPDSADAIVYALSRANTCDMRPLGWS